MVIQSGYSYIIATIGAALLCFFALASALPWRPRGSPPVRLDKLDHMVELGGYVGMPESDPFEGDIELTPRQRRFFRHLNRNDEHHRVTRAAAKAVTRRWPRGVVPYIIFKHPVKGVFSENHKVTIREGMDFLEETTCVKFSEVDSRTILSKPGSLIIAGGWTGSDCQSHVGLDRSKWAQVTWFLSGCLRRGRNGNSVAHELTHVLGFWHEHSRPDRDEYIKIFWDKIKERSRIQFRKYNTSIVDTHNTEYDYNSVMHYSGYEYRRRGSRGMVFEPKQSLPPGAYLGQRQAPTLMDLYQVNKLYSCKAKLGMRKEYSCLGCIDELIVVTLTSNSSNASSSGPVQLSMVVQDRTMIRSVGLMLKNTATGSFAASELGMWRPNMTAQNVTCLTPSDIQMTSIRAMNDDPWKPQYVYLFALIRESAFLLTSRAFTQPLRQHGKEKDVHQALTAAKSLSCAECKTSCLSLLRLIVVTDQPTKRGQYNLPIYVKSGKRHLWKTLGFDAESGGSATQHTFTTHVRKGEKSCLAPDDIKQAWLHKNTRRSDLASIKMAFVVAVTDKKAEYILASWQEEHSRSLGPSLYLPKLHDCSACSTECSATT